MLELPRCVRLAAWAGAVLTRRVSGEDAVRAITGQDEPHAVVTESAEKAGLAAAAVPRAGLTQLFEALAQVGCRQLRLALPVPGDVLGLPGPPAFNQAAVVAGECVLAGPGRGGEWWGLIPEVTAFGSRWEPGHLVAWQVHRVPTPLLAEGGLGEIERELRIALAEGATALSRLDVARWRDDAAERITEIREGSLPRGTLPPTAHPRSVQVLSTAARVRAIVRLASDDDGGAINSWEAQRRAQTLRELEQVSRRAVVAAVNALARDDRP